MKMLGEDTGMVFDSTKASLVLISCISSALDEDMIAPVPSPHLHKWKNVHERNLCREAFRSVTVIHQK